MTVRCTICKAPALADYVNGRLDAGMSNAGIAAGLAAIGGSLDPEVVGRHKKHYVPKLPSGTPKATKRDLAIVVRDRLLDQVERMPVVEEEDGTQWDPLMNKHLAPAISAGLKAQSILDKREEVAKKQGGGTAVLMLIERLDMMSRPAEPPQIEDGMTTEGEFVDVTPE